MATAMHEQSHVEYATWIEGGIFICPLPLWTGTVRLFLPAKMIPSEHFLFPYRNVEGSTPLHNPLTNLYISIQQICRVPSREATDHAV